jgi:alpha-tubulin suppressor-like RCC1 family protein
VKLSASAFIHWFLVSLLTAIAFGCSSDPEPGKPKGPGNVEADAGDVDVDPGESDTGSPGDTEDPESPSLIIEIVDGPEELTNATSATFRFTCNLETCNLRCALDGGTPQPCADAITYENLSDGGRAFEVSGTDPASGLRITARRSWRVDTTPPVVVGLSGPPAVTSLTAAALTFRCSEDPCTYTCRLNAEPFAPCTTEIRYEDLSDGEQRFEVKATDQAGNDGEAAALTWVVDTTAPTVEDLVGPPERTRLRTAAFTFSCSEDVCDFICELTGAERGVVRSARACTSGVSFTSLSDDLYTFAISARDRAGNLGPQRTWSWTVDTVVPVVEGLTGPSDPSNDSAPSFEFGCSKGECTYVCSLSGARQGTVQTAQTCDSGVSLSGLTEDRYTFSVRGTDVAGNQSAAATLAWSVDTTPPVVSFATVPPLASFDDSAIFDIACSDANGCSVTCDLGHDAGQGELRTELWENCGGRYMLDGLEPGLYTLYARGIDGAGNETIHPHSWTVLANDWLTTTTGGSHQCGIRSDGTLWCWGNNQNGQLGLGDTQRRVWPTQVGTGNDWTSVSADLSHTCGIRAGQIFCWGSNQRGQLGQSLTVTQRLNPTLLGNASDWTSLATGTSHSCGIRSGQLWCWGDNTDGQLGLGYTSSEAGATRVGVSRDWAEISAGAGHTCGRITGQLFCWGRNNDGQLGQGDSLTRSAPTRVGTQTDWSRVTTGQGHTCAIRSGQLWCWGDNTQGQTGRGAVTIVEGTEPGGEIPETGDVPERVGEGSDWSDISAGLAHSCGVRSGQQFCWGANGQGQLGLGDVELRAAPQRVGDASDWTRAMAGNQFSCGMRGRAIWCWGANDQGQLGLGSHSGNKSSPVQADASPGFVSVSSGETHSCGVKADQSLWCWGNNGQGQLGLGDRLFRGAPTRVGEGNAWTAVSVGEGHSCGIADGRLWCWGANDHGQLGLGAPGERLSPAQAGDQTDWSVVTAGAGHTCAIRQGTLWCWGRNDSRQLGLADSTPRNTPTRVGDLQLWTDVTAGVIHTCGLREGQAWCWGTNTHGQLGLGDADLRDVPTRLGQDSDWSALTAAAQHSCGVRNGQLWCWGRNHVGQLAQGSTSASSLNPVRVGTGADWTDVEGGGAHSCGLRGAGRLWCWGGNSVGQVGNGSTSTAVTLPEPVGNATDWRMPAPGASHTCGLRSTSLWCWGSNASGKLGDGSAARLVPKELARP